jgi:hypothetical protein
VDDITGILENVEDDLLLKKKFYSIGISANGAGSVEVGGSCAIPSEACSFNVESIQILSGGSSVVALIVDDVLTPIDPVNTPTNLLVDSGIGKIGASSSVALVFGSAYTGEVHFTGEKPQGMSISPENNVLGLAVITIIKEGEPEDGTDFAFTGDFDFVLDDDEDGTLDDTEVLLVPSGTYSVTEIGVPDWVLDSIQCSPEDADVSITIPTLTITVEEDESVVCIFENVMQQVGILG